MSDYCNVDTETRTMYVSNTVDEIQSQETEIITKSRENITIINDISNNQVNDIIQIVCRQTELTENEARSRLEKANYDYMKVLNDYFDVKPVSHDNKCTTNQLIYGEIRNLMDAGARNFRKEQEKAEYIQNLRGSK